MIAQTLHGYDHGHRLLAQGGDVQDRELAVLDRLSDLSGYLPLGTEFDRYHTGFPCGRYYAFACTWPDATALRAGTVLTHTLLIPIDHLANVDDLWQVSDRHRRPMSAAERTPYTVALDAALHTRPPAVPGGDTNRLEAATVLWFGQPDRPVLWVENGRPDDAVRFLWAMLWPDARACFAFCTFALQVRHVQGRPFDFLALPPSARGAFHERARSAAWWFDGQLAGAGLRDLQREPWVKRIIEAGARQTWAMPRFCEQHGLPALEAHDFPVFVRFVELETPAKTRLTASRARADLLSRLWPTVAPEHPLVRAALHELLSLQGQAPLAPRPLWELRDFIERPLVQALYDADGSFTAEVDALLVNELRRRMTAVEDGAPSELAAWVQASPAPSVYAALLRAIRSWLAATSETDGAAAALLSCAVTTGHVDLAGAILGSLEGPRQSALFERVAAEAGDVGRAALCDLAAAAASHLGDPDLAVHAWRLRGDPLEGLRQATRVVLAHPHPRLDRIEALVRAESPAHQLVWALEVVESQLAQKVGSLGASAATELRLSWEDLVARCQGAPNGLRVLLARALSMPTDEVRRALRVDGPVAMALMKSTLHEVDPGAAALLSVVLEVVPEDLALAADIALEMEAAGTAPGAQRFAEIAAPRLVGILAAGRGDGTVWLRLRTVQDAIAHSEPWRLFAAVRSRAPATSWLPNLARAIRACANADPELETFWIARLLERPLEETSADKLATISDDLCALLDLRFSEGDRAWLSASVLHAVRRWRCQACRRLVERTFPVVYRRILDERPWPQRWLVSFWGDGWDLAKAWRDWLVDRWIVWRWPPEGLFVCVGEDEILVRQIVRRAAKHWDGRDFLQRLRAATTKDATLDARWGQAIADAQAGVDYD